MGISDWMSWRCCYLIWGSWCQSLWNLDITGLGGKPGGKHTCHSKLELTPDNKRFGRKTALDFLISRRSSMQALNVQLRQKKKIPDVTTRFHEARGTAASSVGDSPSGRRLPMAAVFHLYSHKKVVCCRGPLNSRLLTLDKPEPAATWYQMSDSQICIIPE